MKQTISTQEIKELEAESNKWFYAFLKIAGLTLALLIYSFINTYVFANNIQVSNVSIRGQNVAENYSMIKFDVSWENSWRVNQGPKNLDAAWIFIKYRIQNSEEWIHATLNFGGGAGATHIKPANASIRCANDDNASGAHGVFLYSSQLKSQSLADYDNVQLRWNYGADGVNDDDLLEISVYAIEMVYIPQGSFYLGTGGNETGHFRSAPGNAPYLVNSEAAINVGGNAGNLIYTPNILRQGDAGGPIPQVFPKGYNSIYCMKYEISQGQFADFLSSVTEQQQDLLYHPDFFGRGGFNMIRSSEKIIALNPDRVCNHLGITGVLSYLDWAALRPMTELEFEKICRGKDQVGLVNEFAWGNAKIASSGYWVENYLSIEDNITLGFSENKGNAIYTETLDTNRDGSINDHPLRCGVFAGATRSGMQPYLKNRVTTGSTYYGVMEMSGSLHEFCVTVGSNAGRIFSGIHGDGNLLQNGSSNVAFWFINGIGERGGSFYNGKERLRTSDRNFAANPVIGGGGRGVRKAP